MNSKEFHQQTILGLIQKTVNTTFTDLGRRQLIEENLENQVINWTNQRILVNEINRLFDRGSSFTRERLSIENIIIEVRARAPSIYTILTDTNAFDKALSEGIKAYSRHIRDRNLVPPPNFVGFQQSLDEQINWGLLRLHQRYFYINHRTSRYLEYRFHIRAIVDRFFQENGANQYTLKDLLPHNKTVVGVYSTTNISHYIELFSEIILRIFTLKPIE